MFSMLFNKQMLNNIVIYLLYIENGLIETETYVK